MSKHLTVILFVLLSRIGVCQDLTPTVISSAGYDVVKDDHKLSYTIGEAVVVTFQKGNYILSQGFHQWPLVYISAIHTAAVPELEVNVYPNPATNYVNVYFSNYILSTDCIIEFYNIFGQKFQLPVSRNRNGSSEILQIELSALDRGTYFVRIIDSGFTKGFVDFKVVKVR
jgi:hypothetical protein